MPLTTVRECSDRIHDIDSQPGRRHVYSWRVKPKIRRGCMNNPKLGKCYVRNNSTWNHPNSFLRWTNPLLSGRSASSKKKLALGISAAIFLAKSPHSPRFVASLSGWMETKSTGASLGWLPWWVERSMRACASKHADTTPTRSAVRGPATGWTWRFTLFTRGGQYYIPCVRVRR